MIRNAHKLPSLASLTTAPPTALYLRDSEVVIYRRSRSLLYQCRYKLANGTWHRQTTGKASIEHAVTAACDLYDQARYRQRLGLAHQAHPFAQLAHLVLAELRQQIDAGRASFSTAYSRSMRPASLLAPGRASRFVALAPDPSDVALHRFGLGFRR